MGKKKKKHATLFAKGKNVSADGDSVKRETAEKRARKRRRGGHLPRDADTFLQQGDKDTFDGASQNGREKAEEERNAADQEFFSRHENLDEKETKQPLQRKETGAGSKRRRLQGRRTSKGVSVRYGEGFEQKAATIKNPKKGKPLSAASRRIEAEGFGFAHQKVSENEEDNPGVEAAHKTEQAAEGTARHAMAALYVFRKRRAASLEKKHFKVETEFLFQKFLEENLEIKKKAFRKRIQKQRIRREYAKALKKGADARLAAGYAQKAAQKTAGVARKLQEFSRNHAGAVAAAGFFGLFFMSVAAGVSSCGTMLSGGISGVMTGSYQSDPAHLDATDEAMTMRELFLQRTIDNIETDHPGYDEYRYDLDAIGHDPFTLASYLSAVYIDVNDAGVSAEVGSLFHDMYELTLTPTTETRTRTVTRTGTRTVTDEATGAETAEEYSYEEEEEYTVEILNVELKNNPLEGIVADRLAGNDDATALYEAYRETHGALQQFYTPLDLDWYGRISSHYGYRRNPITGENQFHRGVDIAVPVGTEVYAAQDGTVTAAQYSSRCGNYVVISDSEGYVTKYANMQSLNVSTGQTIGHGAVIGRVSTGSHLHIECMYNGTYYNPLFYFESGDISR